MADIFAKCNNFDAPDQLKKLGVFPFFKQISQNEGPIVMMEGKKTIMAGSNNYLGLSHDPRVINAAKMAIDKYGTTCSGSRFANGNTVLHEKLEKDVACFLNKEKAFCLTSGYTTNLAAISTLASRGDILIVDRTNHASLVDGHINAIGACVRKYNHNDMENLERILRAIPRDSNKLIVSDGVFSVHGDMVHLPKLIDLANKYNARVYIDDSHGIGVLGKNSKGVGEIFGLLDKIDIIMGTFSKAFASIGGFIAGDQKIIDYITFNARPVIFSASMSPAAVAASNEALSIIRNDNSLKIRLMENSEYMQNNLNDMGFNTNNSSTPIIPVYTYERLTTLKFARRLLDHGVYACPFFHPAVPKGKALIRTSYMATHTKNMLDKVLEAFFLVGKELNVI